MGTRMDGSVLAVIAAYQNNLVTSKMMTTQVAQWSRLQRRENTTLDGLSGISMKHCSIFKAEK